MIAAGGPFFGSWGFFAQPGSSSAAPSRQRIRIDGVVLMVLVQGVIRVGGNAVKQDIGEADVGAVAKLIERLEKTGGDYFPAVVAGAETAFLVAICGLLIVESYFEYVFILVPSANPKKSGSTEQPIAAPCCSARQEGMTESMFPPCVRILFQSFEGAQQIKPQCGKKITGNR
jgi:hypothetical protein